MIVMKFGGTSIQDATSIERVVDIIKARAHLGPVIVVSAMGKTTRALLDIAERATRGERATARGRWEELKGYHVALMRALHVDEALPRVEGYFRDIEQLIDGLAILRELTLRGRDRIASYGELISSVIVTEALKHGGLDAVWLDARQFMITDEHHTRARPLMDITRARIVEHIRPCLQAGRIPVTQGYIGATLHGVTTTLGFEGSDYSAAIIGAALEAEDIQIWTDVHGIMTADPAILPEARTIRAISFLEAKELTHFGAKVLHPSTLFPADEKAIPVHIYNSRHPDGPGTVIAATVPPTRSVVKSIAYKRPVTLLTVAARHASSLPRFFKTAFEAVERAQLHTYLAMTTETRIMLVIDPSESVEALTIDLEPEANVAMVSDQAIVCLVGEHLHQHGALLHQVVQAVGDLPVGAISYGVSEHSLVLILPAANVGEAVKRLHDLLFRDVDPEMFY